MSTQSLCQAGGRRVLVKGSRKSSQQKRYLSEVPIGTSKVKKEEKAAWLRWDAGWLLPSGESVPHEWANTARHTFFYSFFSGSWHTRAYLEHQGSEDSRRWVVVIIRLKCRMSEKELARDKAAR